jgi:hypothetical protein
MLVNMATLIRKYVGLILAPLLLVGGITLGASLPVAAHRQPQPPTSSVLPDGPQPLGAVLRLYDDGPAWHEDLDHWESGIDTSVPPVIDASGFLTFHTKEKNAVIYCVASPDETLVARGITAGCSNGSHLVRLRLVKVGTDGQPAPLDLNNEIHWDRVSGPYSNLWISLIHDGRWEES